MRPTSKWKSSIDHLNYLIHSFLYLQNSISDKNWIQTPTYLNLCEHTFHRYTALPEKLTKITNFYSKLYTDLNMPTVDQSIKSFYQLRDMAIASIRKGRLKKVLDERSTLTLSSIILLISIVPSVGCRRVVDRFPSRFESKRNKYKITTNFENTRSSFMITLFFEIIIM